jgi:hypothetical protein
VRWQAVRWRFETKLNGEERQQPTRNDSPCAAQAAEVFTYIFHLQHEMEWLTWQAAKRPDSFDVSMAAAYESAVHAVYPRILGAMAVLASLDLELYESLQQLVVSGVGVGPVEG